ncbi:hypothetical protein HHJ78_04315 [Mobiluncus mulieris]|uniref:Uncharacterized protein n=1 Tax=Mobiluncus mulieris TaxID=2052 RepID=A0A7Y0U0N2_9ACTO|nr:hypothetical protein [Mobiluncus mulieris]NMW62560.1 hypothetical protein [Mobiluncus mulieris]NMW64770.1 hypothetical protein [Mobiluncus mulieris]NMW93457.1 hypothetical protein [Mobiluncus mulieris]
MKSFPERKDGNSPGGNFSGLVTHRVLPREVRLMLAAIARGERDAR